jgi:hypothetical protein
MNNSDKKIMMRNAHGEYRYTFNWVGSGFNDVWAKNKKEAIIKAKILGYPSYMPNNQYAKKTLNDIKKEFGLNAYKYLIIKYPDIDPKAEGWSRGSIPMVETFKAVTVHESKEWDSMGHMMTC